MALNVETYVLSKHYADKEIEKHKGGAGLETDPVYQHDKPNLVTKDEFSKKQDVLTAGENIVIENNIISATGISVPPETDPIYTADKPNIATKDEVPHNISELKNDKEYITAATEQDPTVPKFIKRLTETDIQSWNDKSDFDGDYNNLKNKPVIPTKTSDLSNDAGYLSEVIETDPSVPQCVKNLTDKDIENWNNKSTFSGDYNDLTNIPEAPDTSNALTFDQLNEQLQTKQDVLIPGENISISNNTIAVDISNSIETDPVYALDRPLLARIPDLPSKTSDLVNDAKYISSKEEKDPTVPVHIKNIIPSDIDRWNNKSSFTGDYDKLTNKPNIPTKTSDLNNDSNFATEDYVNEQLTSFGIMSVVPVLPAIGESNKVYLVPKTNPDGTNSFDEYIWVNDTWELVDNTTLDIDLSNYYNKKDTDTLLATKQNTLKAGDNISIKDNTITALVDAADERDPVYRADRPYLALKSEIPTKLSDLTNDVAVLSDIPKASDTVIGGIKTGNGYEVDTDSRLYSKYVALNEYNDVLTSKENNYNFVKTTKISETGGIRLGYHNFVVLPNGYRFVVLSDGEYRIYDENNRSISTGQNIRPSINTEKGLSVQEVRMILLRDGNVAISYLLASYATQTVRGSFIVIKNSTGKTISELELVGVGTDSVEQFIELNNGNFACVIDPDRNGDDEYIMIYTRDGTWLSKSDRLPGTSDAGWSEYTPTMAQFSNGNIVYVYSNRNYAPNMFICSANGEHVQKIWNILDMPDASETIRVKAVVDSNDNLCIAAIRGKSAQQELRWKIVNNDLLTINYGEVAYDQFDQKTIWFGLTSLTKSGFCITSGGRYSILSTDGQIIIDWKPLNEELGLVGHDNASLCSDNKNVIYLMMGRYSSNNIYLLTIGESNYLIHSRDYMLPTLETPRQLQTVSVYLPKITDPLIPSANTLNRYPIDTMLEQEHFYDLVYNSGKYIATETTSPTLVFDTVPTDNSPNLVTSGAIKKYIDEALAQLK